LNNRTEQNGVPRNYALLMELTYISSPNRICGNMSRRRRREELRRRREE